MIEQGFSIIICTRNRIYDLIKCIQSISKSQKTECIKFLELIIIDDGEIGETYIEKIRQIIEESHIELSYINKAETKGLWKSRIEGVKVSKGDIVIFLDDDVEIESNYLEQLYKGYSDFPEAVGIGGIDTALKIRYTLRLWEILTFLSSTHLGKLSLSGFGGNMAYWIDQPHPFVTEYLSGCNMSYKKKAISLISDVGWLNNYSIGEDLYLSFLARQSGNLFILPSLKVAHHQSQISRDNIKDIASSRIINHYILLHIYKAKINNYLCFFISFIGICIESISNRHRKDLLYGYLCGLLQIISHPYIFLSLRYK